MNTRVNVVIYDGRLLAQGPSSVATADGAVIIPLPTQVKQTLRAGGLVYAGPAMHKEYILSLVECKGGVNNNGRQAILNSAAMQAVNRALGLNGVKNYAFSVHRPPRKGIALNAEMINSLLIRPSDGSDSTPSSVVSGSITVQSVNHFGLPLRPWRVQSTHSVTYTSGP